jgi:hypothetical protein
MQFWFPSFRFSAVMGHVRSVSTFPNFPVHLLNNFGLYQALSWDTEKIPSGHREERA